ncbi:UNVERIFIED_CONTAM: hypothetical protein POZ17_19770 [Ralstonia mannitolilytica]
MENQTYTEKDLVRFGEYLLSKEREKRIEGDLHGKRTYQPVDTKRRVYHADLENWKNKRDGSA